MSDNEEIAKFMDIEIQHVDFDLAHPRGFIRGVWRKLEYDTSWDWLMPVVEKIDLLYTKAFPSDFIDKILEREDPR